MAPDRIVQRILSVRGLRVLLDSDLAALYGVETRTLLQAVRRNSARFPRDFVIELSYQELANLRSQSVISSWGGRRYMPRAFTEHGAVMAATVLKSPRAIEVSIFVVRAFIQMRGAIMDRQALGKRLEELERKFRTHDHAISEILGAIRQLMSPAEPVHKRPIGFVR